jgi:hypothetical protein
MYKMILCFEIFHPKKVALCVNITVSSLLVYSIHTYFGIGYCYNAIFFLLSVRVVGIDT